MLGDVEALHLLFLGSPEAHGHVEGLEEDEARAETPGGGHKQADDLRDQLLGVARDEALDIVVSGRKDAYGEESPCAADAVYAYRADGVVDFRTSLTTWTPAIMMTPARRPITTAAQGST